MVFQQYKIPLRKFFIFISLVLCAIVLNVTKVYASGGSIVPGSGKQPEVTENNKRKIEQSNLNDYEGPEKKLKLEVSLSGGTGDESHAKYCSMCRQTCLCLCLLDFITHMRLHTRRAIFLCPQCSEYFADRFSCNNHIIQQHGEITQKHSENKHSLAQGCSEENLCNDNVQLSQNLDNANSKNLEKYLEGLKQIKSILGDKNISKASKEMLSGYAFKLCIAILPTMINLDLFIAKGQNRGKILKIVRHLLYVGTNPKIFRGHILNIVDKSCRDIERVFSIWKSVIIKELECSPNNNRENLSALLEKVEEISSKINEHIETLNDFLPKLEKISDEVVGGVIKEDRLHFYAETFLLFSESMKEIDETITQGKNSTEIDMAADRFFQVAENLSKSSTDDSWKTFMDGARLIWEAVRICYYAAGEQIYLRNQAYSIMHDRLDTVLGHVSDINFRWVCIP